MMHDSPPQIDPVLNLARNQMDLVANIHLVHLAIVSGRDETKVLAFDDDARAEMLRAKIPALITEIRALGAIVSSPVRTDDRYGAVVTLIDRTLEAFYVPIIRFINMDLLIGDFRTTQILDPHVYGTIHETLSVNWLARGDY